MACKQWLVSDIASPIDSSVMPLSDQEFGSKVFDGTTESVRLGAKWEMSSKPEITNFEVAVAADENILWFQVPGSQTIRLQCFKLQCGRHLRSDFSPVNNVFAVKVGQGNNQVRCIESDGRRIKPPVLVRVNAAVEFATLNTLHEHVEALRRLIPYDIQRRGQ